jgi:nitrite reductase/ring-hydroxylating ferredoxin subunit
LSSFESDLVMAEFVRAVEASRVPPDSMLTVEVGEESVLIANVDGKYFGMGAMCTHEEWDLSEGTLEDTALTCAGHGTVWDLKTGKGVFDEPLPDEPLYDVKEENGFLYVKKR